MKTQFAGIVLVVCLLPQNQVFFIFPHIVIICTLITAKDLPAQHNTMTMDPAAAVPTSRRQGIHRTLETIEDVSYSSQSNFKTGSIDLTANFTTYIYIGVLHNTHKIPRSPETQRATERPLLPMARWANIIFVSFWLLVSF